MSFDLRTFVKRGFLDAVGQMPDYKIILNATGWYEKGLLTEEDLAEIDLALHPTVPETEVTEENEVI